MKVYVSALIALLFSITMVAQSDEKTESTGLPGENFSLEGVMGLLRTINTPEDLEAKINDQDQGINNLDMNNDGEIDYVKVVNKIDGNTQIFILQAIVSEEELQDIAVIELEKKNDQEAYLQIIGDEEIYGEEVIIESGEGTEEPALDQNDASGPKPISKATAGYVVVNVWSWPFVRYVYAPAYKPWVSPWKWRNYPNRWKPWRPMSFAVWQPIRVRHYHPTYRLVRNYRIANGRKLYAPVRVTSRSVNTRYSAARANHKVTRRSTTITGPRGNSVTRKTTTVKGRHGKVKASKTKVTRSRRG